MRLPLAKSMTAARSFLLQDQRNTAWLRLPDWRVDGQAPARRGQGIIGGEPLPAVTDLGQQARGADRPGARQAGEDVLVGMGCEQAADLGVQGGDLGVERGDHGHQRDGDLAAGLALGAGQSRCRSGQPVMQDPRR